MNVYNIALREIKSSLREPRTMLFMLAFPIVLMLILGTALSNVFSNFTPVDNIRLLYSNESGQPQLTQYWESFSQEMGRQGIDIAPIASGQVGREQVREGQYTAYVELKADGMQLYGSSKQSIESNIAQGMLTAFADRYNLAAAAFRSDPSKAEAILANAGAVTGGEFIRETSLNPNKSPGSIDYYAIAMTTMIALYAAISGSYLFRGERTRHTAIRLMAAPIAKGELFAGKVIGCTLINFLSVLVVVLFSKFVFQADWGSHYGIVFLVLGTEVVLAVSLGLGVGYLVQGESPRAVVMIFTQIASFVGGAYFPVESDGSFMGVLTYLSPLRWANTALIGAIYTDDMSAAWQTIGLNVGIAAAFLLISIVIMRKREVL
ncbi:ABC transporter permease [Cohnella terricola]|uniref:ABC transporter permease n=1 Tax=Cohnella terricola TaxID=1289167 RepID=A0A559JAG0_9BACL|nr:ABC transporter permease [Cohnella terricola]TVX96843.1 ABC transporter permease [Cohnella terricola]